MSLDKKHFGRMRTSGKSSRFGQMVAWKESVKVFLKHQKDRAYTAREIAQLLGISVDDVYIALHDLCYRNVTRKGRYFAWGK